MEQYLRLKLEQRDWHGVADAAMDIREIEAQLRNQPIVGEPMTITLQWAEVVFCILGSLAAAKYLLRG